jgi:hypothetical protein
MASCGENQQRKEEMKSGTKKYGYKKKACTRLSAGFIKGKVD